ncbi:polymorphic toxin type 15 domain-containing protein [Staphylococcus epidermidis]|nr:polymorphic toxin type 15 domain-containing protein [Staphylococcus epidermidis]MCO6330724.1 polymorphic toxin type 15 domain-containing protein [Staphylococcus epidermidis]
MVKSEGKHVSHTNYSRENIKRIELISISFKRNINHDEKEFYRQLKDQEEGLNKLTVKEYMDNREKYIKNGRDIEEKHYQKEARNKAKNEKLEELLNQGFSKNEAKARVSKIFQQQAALHNPNMIAGGHVHNIGSLGDKKINSSLGSQWKYRIDDLDYQIIEQSKKI